MNDNECLHGARDVSDRFRLYLPEEDIVETGQIHFLYRKYIPFLFIPFKQVFKFYLPYTG